ncbi:unnamed protein product [Amoebophrya sp. A25]|nr:unnamed protein product [Amoebophrya sp. A25]|eukprot:GSA25T00011846001.1
MGVPLDKTNTDDGADVNALGRPVVDSRGEGGKAEYRAAEEDRDMVGEKGNDYSLSAHSVKKRPQDKKRRKNDTQRKKAARLRDAGTGQNLQDVDQKFFGAHGAASRLFMGPRRRSAAAGEAEGAVAAEEHAEESVSEADEETPTAESHEEADNDSGRDHPEHSSPLRPGHEVEQPSPPSQKTSTSGEREEEMNVAADEDRILDQVEQTVGVGISPVNKEKNALSVPVEDEKRNDNQENQAAQNVMSARDHHHAEEDSIGNRTPEETVPPPPSRNANGGNNINARILDVEDAVPKKAIATADEITTGWTGKGGIDTSLPTATSRPTAQEDAPREPSQEKQARSLANGTIPGQGKAVNDEPSTIDASRKTSQGQGQGETNKNLQKQNPTSAAQKRTRKKRHAMTPEREKAMRMRQEGWRTTRGGLDKAESVLLDITRKPSDLSDETGGNMRSITPNKATESEAGGDEDAPPWVGLGYIDSSDSESSRGDDIIRSSGHPRSDHDPLRGDAHDQVGPARKRTLYHPEDEVEEDFDINAMPQDMHMPDHAATSRQPAERPETSTALSTDTRRVEKANENYSPRRDRQREDVPTSWFSSLPSQHREDAPTSESSRLSSTSSWFSSLPSVFPGPIFAEAQFTIITTTTPPPGTEVPWLVSGQTRPSVYVPPSKAVAIYEGNYTIDTNDFTAVRGMVKDDLIFALRKWIATEGTPPVETSIKLPREYVNETDFTLLWENNDCSAKGSTPYIEPPVTVVDNSIRFDATQMPINPGWIPNRWQYPDTSTVPATEDPALDVAASRFTFCVDQYETTLRWINDVPATHANGDEYLDPKLPNAQWIPPGIHITGERDATNTFLLITGTDPVEPVKARMWIIGQTWISLLQLLDKRLKFPRLLTTYVPEIIPGTPDPTALLSDDLYVKASNAYFSMEIEWMNHRNPNVATTLDKIPVCRDALIPKKGCGRFRFTFYDYPSHITDYKLNYFIRTRRLGWQSETSEGGSTPRYTLTLGESNYTWLEPPPTDSGDLWTVTYYPQTDWRYLTDCKTGSPCSFIPIAPSGRFLHTMTAYRTWSHHEAYLNLCAGEPLQSPEMCIDDKNVCHYNLTCLGGVDAYFARQDVRGNYYYRSAFFIDADDGLFEPLLENTHQTCPPSCCKERRMCMRTHDVTGSEVPFDRTMLLVFGGRTYVHDYTFPKFGEYKRGIIQDTDPKVPGIQSELIWHECEFMDKSAFDLVTGFRELRSCLELATDELWRYDTVVNQWQFMKFDTSQSDTSTDMVGTPKARYAHAAQLIIYTRASDPDNVRRQYMYIFGGAAMQCRFGLCDDLWRYEIPWASMAYYPQFPARPWQQGNQWFLRSKANKLCVPQGNYCGRFRHSMVASYDNQFLFVFGGQGIGRWETSLFRYRVFTDMWENLDPDGIKSITRFAIDYNNIFSPETLDASHYDPEIDENIPPNSIIRQLCNACGAVKAKRTDGGNSPKGRGDLQMQFFRRDYPLMIFGGFSTEWSYLHPLPQFTGESYTRNASAVMRTYDFESIDPDFERNRYYYDDTWIYNQKANLWVKHYYKEGTYERPKARKGHTMVIRRQTTGDAQAILYGGQLQDEPLGDLWSYDVERPLEDRKWQRLDNTFEGTRPAKIAFHTSVWDEPNNEMLMFGGITWVKTDLNNTDDRRDRDRRCFKSAKDLPTTFHDRDMKEQHPQLTDLFVVKGDPDIAADLVRSVQLNCDDPNRQLCCPLANNFPRPQTADEELRWNNFPDPKNPLICDTPGQFTEENGCRRLVLADRDGNSMERITASAIDQNKERVEVQYDLIVRDGPARNYLNLTAMRFLCKGICDVNEFTPLFRPNMHLGVWRLRPDVCPNNCSNTATDPHRGVCEFSHCICANGWTGPDCSVPQCPGSPCYSDPNSMEYHCIECSGRGLCVSERDSSGGLQRRCQCHTGWAGEDCSMASCYKNCSSTPFVHRGYCWNEYPAEQCVCAQGFEGSHCQRKLCVNKCSGNGVCVNGECICDMYWVGPDCSVMTFSPARSKETSDRLPQ